MKVLIWLVCILVYSAAVSALNLAGVGLGGVPVVLLAILLIFLPAPALCRLLDRRRQQCQDAAADPSAPAKERRSFPAAKVRSLFRSRPFMAACFISLLALSFLAGGFVWRKLEGQMLWDAACIVGRSEGYDDGYADGLAAGYDAGYLDGESVNHDELSFYRDNAVIVTLGGEKYHRWGCSHVSGRQYLIYNIGLAELRGYAPCLDCWEG